MARLEEPAVDAVEEKPAARNDKKGAEETAEDLLCREVEDEDSLKPFVQSKQSLNKLFENTVVATATTESLPSPARYDKIM